MGLVAEEELFQVLHRLCDKNRHLKRLSHEKELKKSGQKFTELGLRTVRAAAGFKMFWGLR